MCSIIHRNYAGRRLDDVEQARIAEATRAELAAAERAAAEVPGTVEETTAPLGEAVQEPSSGLPPAMAAPPAADASATTKSRSRGGSR